MKSTLFITGGASGIGAACAKLGARRGSHVILADKNYEMALDLATELKGEAVALDVADADQVRSVIGQVVQKYARIDGLIHCAGVLQRPLPPDELTLKEWDLNQAVNVRGTYLVASMVGGEMAKQGSGSIVLISSVAGMRSAPLYSYGPAKAGVISLASCLAMEWGHHGVRVNAISPGFTKTPALSKGIDHHVLNKKNMEKSSALGRLVEAEEVASAALFLLSDQASAITGVNLPVDAGYLVATPWQAYRTEED